MLTIAVLGPVEVRRDGRPLRVPSGKPAELLVRLALEAGTPVRADRLIEDLWGADAVDVERNTLQSKVSQLRRALGDPALLTHGAGGYTLVIDPASVDTERVIHLAAEADSHRRSGDATAARIAADEALALFRGELLAGDADWLVPHRTRFEEIRCGLLETRAAARVDLDAAGEVIADLEVLVAEHPLREGLWHTLVTALYRTGRQAEALAACVRVRTLLRDELGLEPGPALRTLERDILRQTVPVPVPPRAPAGNLPALSSPLTGRSADLADVVELVGRQRLVTLVGPAGVGKTRLAVEVARTIELPGGRWLVRLDEVDAGASILEVDGADAAGADRAGNCSTGWPGPTPCWCSTTASTSSTRPPPLSRDSSIPGPACGCSRRASVRSGSTARACARSPRSRSRIRCGSSAHVPPPHGRALPPTPRRSNRCAGAWTGCRSRSNSPPRASGRCPCGTSRADSTTGSPC